MTISEALAASKETGRSFARSGAFGPIGYAGWIAYHETHLYHGLTATDLMASDWVTSAEMMECPSGRVVERADSMADSMSGGGKAMSGKADQKVERDGSYSRSEAAEEMEAAINKMSSLVKTMMDSTLAQERREIAKIVSWWLTRFAMHRWGMQTNSDRSNVLAIGELAKNLCGIIVGRSAEGGE